MRLLRRPSSALFTALLVLAGLSGVTAPAEAQNVSIQSWQLPGQVRSADVKIRNVGSPLTDHFDPTDDDNDFADVSLIKSDNYIYVRFRNTAPSGCTTAVIADGAVEVAVEYVEAPAGLAASSLVSSLPASGWKLIGKYPMSLVGHASDPPTGWGLLPGQTYPRGEYPPGIPREFTGHPDLYRVVCSNDCSQPLPTSFFLRATLSLTGDTCPADNTAHSYYDLTSGKKPADIVLLHDASGSMAGEMTSAQERAKMFLALLNPGDRIGVVAFDSYLPGYAQVLLSLQTISSIFPADPAKTAARIAINTLAAGGGTPMGTGVIEARTTLNAALPPYSPNRAIVMLTDGKENVSPDVKNPPSYPILTGLNNDTKGKIALYPLWFGTLSHWGKSLLEDVVLHVDLGKLVDQPDDNLKLAEAYLMIRGILTSDDVYAIHRGTSGDAYEGATSVDAVTDELILTAAWVTFARDLDVEVLPPGATQWLPAGTVATSTSHGQIWVVHRIQNPASGEWRYRLAPTGAAGIDFVSDTTTHLVTSAPGDEPYVLSALADTVEILMQSSLADSSVAAGEPLVINARLSQKGQGVPGATVRATVKMPDRALGTILNRYRDSLQTPAPGPGPDGTRATGILKELQQLLGSDQLFKYQPRTVVLHDDGTGNYTGRFEDTKVAGTYQITIVAENAPQTADSFRREHRHAAVVGFGPLDLKRSLVDLQLLDRVGPEGAAIWQVKVVPVDIHGNYADPGYGSRISVDATGGVWTGDLVDNDDGAYTRYLQVNRGQQATVEVTAFKEKLPPRQVQPGGPSGGRTQFSFHLGAVVPTGTFGNFFNEGPSVMLDFGYRLRPSLTVLALLGVHEFPDRHDGSETVLQLSGNLRKSWPGGVVSPYVQGGPGAYRIFSDWEAGLNLGVGLIHPASPSVDLEGGVDYHTIFLPGADAEFWQLHLGFAIRP